MNSAFVILLMLPWIKDENAPLPEDIAVIVLDGTWGTELGKPVWGRLVDSALHSPHTFLPLAPFILHIVLWGYCGFSRDPDVPLTGFQCLEVAFSLTRS